MQSNFTYKNIAIGYSCFGKGPSIVLLHGFLENRFMWNDVIGELSSSYRIVCIDLLGHGESGQLGYVHSMEDQANMVKTLLDFLRLRKYIMLGHSMGGYVALNFAMKHPDNLKGLCLMNSTALPDSALKKENRERAIKAVRQNHRTFIKLAIPMLFAEKNRKFFTTEINTIISEALKMSPRGIVAALRGMKERTDSTEIYHKDLFPIMLIVGEEDPALEYHSLVRQVRNTKVQFINLPGGHMSHIENYSVFLKSITVFFRFCSRK